MATFEYEAVVKSSGDEQVTEQGVVVAETRVAAEEKLKQRGLTPANVKRLGGLKAFIKSFTANVK